MNDDELTEQQRKLSEHDPRLLQMAAVLVVHHARRDMQAIEMVMRQAVQDGLWGNLTLSILGLYEWIIPELRTPGGVSLMNEMILTVAASEEDVQ